MTREEAIKNIREHCYFASLLPQAKEALDMAIKALENQKSVIEELEKIKAEMENPKVISMDFFDGLAYVEEIIDNRISELKGENNE